MTNVKPEVLTKPIKPKGWIRWPGVILLLGISGLVYGLYALALNGFIKSQIESQASVAWGAKVEIGSLSLSIEPLALALEHIQLTDPDKPMENLLVIERLGASFDFYQLAVGRTVINEIVFKGLALHQARSESGALPLEETVDQKAETPQVELVKTSQVQSEQAKQDPISQLESLKMPEDILARETLETNLKVNQIQKEVFEIDQAWSDIQSRLPSEKELKNYRQRFLQLTDDKIHSLQDLEERKNAFADLNKEISNKREAIEEAEDLFSKRLPALKKEIGLLKDLPEKDYQQLLKHYRLDEQGVSNVAYLLFGPKVQTWLNEGLAWYQKAAPYLQNLQSAEAETKSEEEVRGAGIDVAFVEKDPQPDFIIKKITGSASLPVGRLALEVLNVNREQVKSGLPIRYFAEVQPQGQVSPLTFRGISDVTRPDKPDHHIKIQWPNYQIKNWKLSADEALPLSLQQGQAETDGLVRFLPGGKLDGQVTIDYQNIDFRMAQNAKEETRRYLKPVFNDIHQFAVTTSLGGKLISPKLEVNSDLDKQLSKAFKRMLQQKVEAYQAELKQKIMAKAQAQIEPLEVKLSQLTGQQVSLSGQGKELGDLTQANFERRMQQWQNDLIARQKAKLKAELEAKQKAAEAEAKAKLAAQKKAAEEKIAAEKAKLAAQKRAEEEKAKAKLEAEKKKQQEAAKKELEKQLKNKLKF